MLNSKYSLIATEVLAGGSPDNDGIVKTGYNQLDTKLNGGLRYGCCYLFTGIEKSGKSSFIFNIMYERMMSDKPCAILSTEMDCADVIKRLMTIAGLGDNVQERLFFNKMLDKYLTFYGKDDLNTKTENGNKYDFGKFLKAIDEVEKQEIDFVIIDNLTTLGAEAGDYKVLGNYTNQLITHVKDKKIAVIFVIHVKQDTSFKETPQGIRQLIKAGKAEEVFKESITVISRPTLKDVYGGGQALSQISGGTIMLWRPFQKFDLESFQRMGMVIIDSHRFGPSADIPVQYEGTTGKFWELT